MCRTAEKHSKQKDHLTRGLCVRSGSCHDNRGTNVFSKLAHSKEPGHHCTAPLYSSLLAISLCVENVIQVNPPSSHCATSSSGAIPPAVFATVVTALPHLHTPCQRTPRQLSSMLLSSIVSDSMQSSLLCELLATSISQPALR